MEIHITFRHIKSSEAVKEHIEEKLHKLDKYKEKASEAHVILSVEGNRHLAEIIYTAKQFQAVGKSETTDMYVSIDDAISTIENLLKKHHSKKAKSRAHASA